MYIFKLLPKPLHISASINSKTNQDKNEWMPLKIHVISHIHPAVHHTWLIMYDFRYVIVNEQGQQTIISEFDSYWVALTPSFVLN